jgi:DNA-binding transcriptional MerR regulator
LPGPVAKATGAFRTIGELSRETGLPAHILRFWETRFPQLKPLTRAGQRRYYRPEDVALVKRIDALLNHQGYTIRGVQQLLAADEAGAAPPSPAPAPASTSGLQQIRDALAAALADDDAAPVRAEAGAGIQVA